MFSFFHSCFTTNDSFIVSVGKELTNKAETAVLFCTFVTEFYSLSHYLTIQLKQHKNQEVKFLKAPDY